MSVLLRDDASAMVVCSTGAIGAVGARGPFASGFRIDGEAFGQLGGSLADGERGVFMRMHESGNQTGEKIVPKLLRTTQCITSSNAIKYNREGGFVDVSTHQKREGWLTLAVRDTGRGIAPKDLQKLFTPFERLHASDSEIEGSGLGLVLSQHLMRAMGGTLSMESTLGEGTIFAIELPQAVLSEAQLMATAEDIHPLDADTEVERKYTVLYIEDNPSNLRLVEVLFQSMSGITLLVAMQGSIGLLLAQQHEPDIILLVLNLPDMHGNEVLTRLQQSALTRHIPVIIITADATPTQVERLLAAGASAYLTKPLNVDQFFHTLNTFLHPSKAE